MRGYTFRVADKGGESSTGHAIRVGQKGRERVGGEMDAANNFCGDMQSQCGPDTN